MTRSDAFNPLGAMWRMLFALAALLVPVLGTALSAGSPWSWAPADAYAPDASLFVDRGSATVEFGGHLAAPGGPPDKAHMYGVIRYRDDLEGFRDYDLFFSPTLAIWKLRRYELDDTTFAQYVGGFHYSNCGPDFWSGYRTSYPLDQGFTAMDRVFTPGMGLHPQFANDVEDLNTTENIQVRTNYGCQNNNNSSPVPIEGGSATGSGDGDLPRIVLGPTWTSGTQTLFTVSIPIPWVFYEGVLDPVSPRFIGDFNDYAPPLTQDRRAFIQSQIAAALENVRLENQIRILPDGTIMLTHMWTDLQARPWVPFASDSYWLAPDSSPNGRVVYWDINLNQYVEPFAGGANPEGMHLSSANGWVGIFVDEVRTDFGIAFYYDREAGSIAIFPADNFPDAPAVAHPDYWTNLAGTSYFRAFRQFFLTIGTKEEMQQRAGTLNNYTEVFTVPPPTVESFCSDGIDDDHDGLTDCADPDCDADLSCLDAGTGPDFDEDGDVDQEDFGHLQSCFTASPFDPIDPGCSDADLDLDDHVDQNDFDAFLMCVGGANIPYPPGCTEVCDDGIDNDADGLIDCADPDCWADPTCPEICDNGIDDDTDGYVDCRDTRCAGDPSCPAPEVCDDALDNDLDGLTDCTDPDCAADPACPEICDNGVDDNADGDVDCGDTRCAGDPACPAPEVCDDGVDNDIDALTDCADPDCTDDAACPEVCYNGLDEDADALIDCDDPDCSDNPACPELCENGDDDDGDGDVDCADSECSSLEPCVETLCSDSLDGDNDGLTDCDDPDCAVALQCGGVVCIQPASAQDGHVFVAGSVAYATSTAGIYGWHGGSLLTQIGIHTFPVGITSAHVGSAELRIPQTDHIWTADGSQIQDTEDWRATHIDAAVDTLISAADATSAALADIGLWRAAGPTQMNVARFTTFDVTSHVKADLDAGRATFAWRLDVDAPIPLGLSQQMYFPTVDNTDPAFPVTNRGATICITPP